MKPNIAADRTTGSAASRSLASLPTPSKLYVEVTSRCNLTCGMCVKQTPGSGIYEGDLSLAAFEALAPALPHVTALMLNGIGEPLLHPQLETFIRTAKPILPVDGWVGFQTNGLLLDHHRAAALAETGLDRICLSVDGATPDTFKRVRGGELSGIARAMEALRRVQTIETGVEFVVQQRNLEELPDVLRWAIDQGATFALVSHLIAYDADLKDQVAYDPNTDQAVALFNYRREQAAAQGINLARYFAVKWKYHKNDEEQQIVDTMEAVVNDAADMGIFLHPRSLLERNPELSRRLDRVFETARQIAAAAGLALELPAVAPKAEKRCEFIENGVAFVSWNGDVHPCHFLWHQYTCNVSKWHKTVNPKVFGRLPDNDILAIWNDPAYRRFRDTVRTYDYPLCSNCNLAPCDYIDSPEFEHDCYTNTVPCCDCQWCLGVFKCMQ